MIDCLFTVFVLMMENCFRNGQNIRKNVHDIIISPIYHKTISQLSSIFLNIHFGIHGIVIT